MAVVKPKVVPVQDEAAPVPKEVLAASIVAIAKAAVHLTGAGLKRRDVVALIWERTKASTGRREIEDVLNAIEQLEKDYAPRR